MARIELIKVEFSKVNLTPRFLQQILETSCEESLRAGFSLTFQSTRLSAARILQTARFDGSRFVLFTPDEFCALYRASYRLWLASSGRVSYSNLAYYHFCEFYCEEFAKNCPWQTKYYQPFKH